MRYIRQKGHASLKNERREKRDKANVRRKNSTQRTKNPSELNKWQRNVFGTNRHRFSDFDNIFHCCLLIKPRLLSSDCDWMITLLSNNVNFIHY